MKSFILYLAFFIAVITIAYAPLYHEISLTPKGTYYPLIHGLFGDYFGYISYIRQGSIQNYQINQSVSETLKTSNVHIFYTILGKISQFTSISPINIYHLSIFSSLVLYFVYVSLLVNLIIPGRLKWLCLFIIFFTGPLPNIDVKFYGNIYTLGTPWWTRMDQYNRLSLTPHHFISTAFLVAGVYHTLRFWRVKETKQAVIAGIYNFTGIVFFAVPGIIFITSFLSSLIFLCLTKWKQFIKNFYRKETRGTIIIIISACFGLILSYLELKSEGRIWSWEYNTFRVERDVYVFYRFVLSYGILPLIILPSLIPLVRKKKFEYVFLIFLFVLPFIFYQLSVNGILQINKLRFVYGAPYVFAGILVTLGLKRASTKIKYIAGILLIFSSIIGLKYYWWPKLFEVNILENRYISAKKIEAAEFLNDYTPKYSILMTDYYDGLYLPAFTYNRVYLGHEIDTLDFWDKFKNITPRFYSGEFSKGQLGDFFKINNIQYVWWKNKTKPPDFYMDFLTLFASFEDVTIYKVL